MQTHEKDRSSENVRAVNRALDVLLAFTRDDFELSATDLLQRVDLSRPTLYRLLYTLEAKGFIASVGEPQRFRLGPAVARLSHVWTETQDLALIAEPILRALWAETRETVALLVPQGLLRYCIAELPSPQPLVFKRGVGSSERIARGASGRAILAHMVDSGQQIEHYTEGLDIDLAKLRRELQATRERGYAVSRDELIEGAVAVAAPFFDSKGVAGSLGVFGPATRLNDRVVATWGRRVVEAAGQLSQALGVPPPLREPSHGGNRP
ncbi:IclR family transcriptional regulator [Pseudorhodoferax sp.]|uniref:IclR family transcriptional regulator n=1 Tax=Pseudorhodoferax sp. TaxID=1993553 RepID=UPI002DD65F1A|nr:IclR family transcriptional regulator [Pseudorhodoferax sp.]